MNNNPLFSILIANYNNGHYIDKAILSVFNQSYSNWELVIVDDNSTDNSLEYLSKLESNDRIRICRNIENKGVGYTKNRCIQLSKGELCGFLDPDDALDSNALQIMVDEFTKNLSCSLIYSNHYVCDEKLNILQQANYVGILNRNDFLLAEEKDKNISHFAVFRRNIYENTEGISVEMKKAIDHDLYYLLEEQGAVLYIDIPLYYYRYHSGNISLGRINSYKAMFWDFNAKSKAFKRRIAQRHKLYLANKPIYNDRCLYTSLVTLFFFKQKPVLSNIYVEVEIYLKSKNKRWSIFGAILMITKAFALVFVKYPIVKFLKK